MYLRFFCMCESMPCCVCGSCCARLFFILAFGGLIFCCSAAGVWLCLCLVLHKLLCFGSKCVWLILRILFLDHIHFTFTIVCTFISHQHSCLRFSLASVTVMCHFCSTLRHWPPHPPALPSLPFNHRAQNYSKREPSASLQSISRLSSNIFLSDICSSGLPAATFNKSRVWLFNFLGLSCPYVGST